MASPGLGGAASPTGRRHDRVTLQGGGRRSSRSSMAAVPLRTTESLSRVSLLFEQGCRHVGSSPLQPAYTRQGGPQGPRNTTLRAHHGILPDVAGQGELAHTPRSLPSPVCCRSTLLRVPSCCASASGSPGHIQRGPAVIVVPTALRCRYMLYVHRGPALSGLGFSRLVH